MTANPDSQPWARIAERGSMWGLRFTSWCYRAFGRRLTSPLVHAVVIYFFLTDAKGRRASAAYLKRIHATPEGRASLGRSPGAWTSFLHYRAFALSIVDRLAIWFGQAEDFAFEMQGSEIVDRVTAAGKGAIMIGAHLGSFDALRLIARRNRFVVNVLMFTAHAEGINTIFRELSPEVETRVIQVDPSSVGSIFRVRKCLERGELVAILADRMEPGDQSRSSAVTLLGSPVELPHAPFLLAHLLRVTAVLVFGLREGPGRYTVYCEELAVETEEPRNRTRTRHDREAQLEQLLTAYAARLEHYCKRYPLQWFNFFDYWRDEESP